jgi:hypothetical protein
MAVYKSLCRVHGPDLRYNFVISSHSAMSNPDFELNVVDVHGHNDARSLGVFRL